MYRLSTNRFLSLSLSLSPTLSLPPPLLPLHPRSHRCRVPVVFTLPDPFHLPIGLELAVEPVLETCALALGLHVALDRVEPAQARVAVQALVLVLVLEQVDVLVSVQLPFQVVAVVAPGKGARELGCRAWTREGFGDSGGTNRCRPG